MDIVQTFKEYEDFALSNEKQEEFKVQNPYIEPWELRHLAVPGVLIGLIIAPFFTLPIFFPFVVGLGLFISVLILKENRDLAKLFASSYTIILALYFVVVSLFGIFNFSFITFLNCLLLAYTLGVLSITIQFSTSDLKGEKLISRRKAQIDSLYSQKYLRYKYFRRFWDSQLKAIVEEIHCKPEFKDTVKRWYSLVQSLEALNERRIFLQRELDLNSSLITSQGLPLTENDISASRYSDQVFTIQLELNTKIDILIEEIDQAYLDMTTMT
ncbi:MAG: hypothetical protein KC646_04995 [Candidatus Cloacimonetes bacterium]|nr:hypothetical protein [Candidatus Cloacimonadota bacterium]